eukprot:TRINITY_DN17598_c0_g1_i2.p1 TRINITY_DN17598_c0_g1~~TRINITY_DN17598_c0_g1_i2.p1  ORF type:complete len:632 (-),score=66.75 TRINITY_DN17598_c0_g1_i2:144-2039(-)
MNESSRVSKYPKFFGSTPRDSLSNKRSFDSQDFLKEIRFVTEENNERCLLGDQLLYLPREALETSPGERATSYISFSNLMPRKRTASSQLVVTPKEGEKSSSIFKQLSEELAHNKFQSQLFMQTMEGFRQNIKVNLQKETHWAARKPPAIRVYPSNGQPPLIPRKRTLSNQIQFEKLPVRKKGAEIKDKAEQENEIRFYWSHIDMGNSFKPSMREGATFTLIEGRGYLYGGLSRTIHNDVTVYNFKTAEWEESIQSNDSNNIHSRLGHTAVAFRRKLYVFGGEKMFNPTVKIRDCFNDVRTFDTQTKKWNTIKPSSDTMIEPRRNHIAVVVGNYMFVNGGITSTGRFMNDTWILDLALSRWKKVRAEGRPVAFHAAVAVVSTGNRPFQLFRQWKQDPHCSYPEGIYSFGGLNEKGEILDSLRVLKLSNQVWCWETVQASGVPPKSRYHCTMSYFEPKKFLLVIGGRNDRNIEKPCFDDVLLFSLERMSWTEVSTYGQALQPRYGHCTTIFGNQLFLLGGITFTGAVPPKLDVLELDDFRVMRFLHKEKAKAQRPSRHFVQKSLVVQTEPNELDAILEKDDFMEYLNRITKPRPFVRGLLLRNKSIAESPLSTEPGLHEDNFIPRSPFHIRR